MIGFGDLPILIVGIIVIIFLPIRLRNSINSLIDGIGLYCRNCKINIIFNALLVPDYGMIGAATAGLISNSFLVVTTFYLSKRSLRWVLPLRESAVIFARALCMGVIIWLGIKVFGSENPLVLMSILAIAGLAYALLDYLDKRSSLFSIIR